MTKEKRINEEEVCIDAFIHYLECMDKNVEVAFYKEENDPPDYWAKVNGYSYAVEVTSITSDIKRLALCGMLHESVKEEFLKESGPAGIYAINFKGNVTPPKRNSKEWGLLVARILRAMQSVSNSEIQTPIIHSQFPTNLAAIARCPALVAAGKTVAGRAVPRTDLSYWHGWPNG